MLYRGDDTLKDLMKVVSDIWNKNIYFMEEHVTKCIYQGEEYEPITVYLRLKAPNDMMKCAIKLILRTISDIVRVEDYRWYNNVFQENLL